ncbi:gastrula zinc finger protein XlCGF57.1-like [Spea bombifrons]|uniref:gastrula zinc finger protein XlCGF57.1-like n=1 Tax=Spea bombifrons TaxID=233779 RepID=UPI0023490BFA|nr:gastrula zinc finger protein XlCGF57.1-like [Spea bombifrons]
MDKDPVAEKILSLTLEIISLLSGEDYMIVRKPSDCVPPSDSPRVSDGHPGTRSPSPVPPPHSLTHERNREQKILELTNKMMSLLTGEVSAAGNGTLYSNTEACVWMVTAHCVSQVPVRCDDVTVYFSMEEWEYLEGHKELYRDVMMETHQPRGSPDASEVRDRAPDSPLDCKTSHFIKEESASCEETDICDAAESPQTELTSTHNEDGSPSDEDGNVSAPDTHTEHDGGDNTSVHVKEESASNEDYWIPTEHKESTSTDKTQTSNTHFQCETPPDEGTYSCPECQEQFTSDSDLIQHQTIHDRSVVSSLDCGKTCQRIHRDEKPYSCPECGKRFNHKFDFVRHQRTHTGEKPFPCPECGKHFSRNWHLVQHLRIHSKEKPFSCSECEKSFNSNWQLVQHFRTHTGEEPYSCPECGKRFKSSSHRTQHLRVHTGEKPFSCSECGKRFKQYSSFSYHQRTHTGEKPFPCSECGRCFSSKASLGQHVGVHAEEKPFSCSECSKSFTNSASFALHQRTHTGEKLLSCSVCGKCFTSNFHLVQHFRIHTGERPFACSECGKRFNRNWHLVLHLRIHSGEKPFSCSQCGKCFKQRSHFVAHQQTQHG